MTFAFGKSIPTSITVVETSISISLLENCFKILPRQALHAKTLGFTHPKTGEWMSFNSDLPEDMLGAIEKWRNYAKNQKEMLE